MTPAHRVILDTDIGSDVDDALALAMLFGAPDVELLGVTTVYGDVELRARIARRLARLAGHDGLTVVPGAERPLSGADAWWAGFEGRLYADLGAEVFMDDVSAADYLVETVTARPGEVDVVAVGPLTNIAMAIRSDPGFVTAVRRLYVMGGRFDAPEPEHNFRSDAQAAAEVFASGIAATVVGLDVTTRPRLYPDHIATIATAGALGRQLEAEVHQWWEFVGTRWNHPHDPIAVLAMLRPDLLAARPARVRVEEGSGVSVAESLVDDAAAETAAGVDSAAGNAEAASHNRTTRVVADLDVTAAVDEIVRLIEAAGHRGPS